MRLTMKLPSPLEVAFAQLASPSASLRKLGAQALCSLQPHGEAAAVREAFRVERDPGVAKWLALTLAQMGDTGSIEVLEGRLRVLEDGDLRDWILVSLNMLRGFAFNRDIVKQLDSSDPASNKEGLILAWRNPHLRADVHEGQRRLLSSADPGVRRWASLSLGSRPDFTADEAILEHLSDPDYLALEWTEHVITGRVPNEALEKLETNLGHKEPRVREWAIKALASSPTPGVYAHLMRHYAVERDEFCRDAILRGLLPVSNTPEVHDFLVRCAKTETSPVTIAALLDIVAANAALRTDETLAVALIEKVRAANSPTLQLAFARSFSAHLSATDIELIRQLDLSPNAKETWSILSALPWETAHGETRGTSAPKRKLRLVMESTNERCDIAVVIAKKEEFRAFLSLFGAYETGVDAQTRKSTYHFELAGIGGRTIHLAALLVGGMGNVRSALWVEKLNRDLRPKIIVNIGIAGGVHEDVTLGDVVVASQVEDYFADAKAVPSQSGLGFEFLLAGEAFKTDVLLVNSIQNLEFSHPDVYAAWQSECATASRTILAEKRTFLIEKTLLREAPALEEGHIASGPVVGAADAFVAWLKAKGDRSYLALEMESAGGAMAIHELAIPAKHLVIRGISDFGDERKRELDAIGRGGLRKLAMQNATRLLLSILASFSWLTADSSEDAAI